MKTRSRGHVDTLKENEEDDVHVVPRTTEETSGLRKEKRTVLLPREDEVIIRKTDIERTRGGLYLPPASVSKADGFVAQVIAVSRGFYSADGTWCEIRDIAVGDTVLVRGNRGTRFVVPNGNSEEQFWYVSCHDIVVVFHEVDVTVDPKTGKVVPQGS